MKTALVALAVIGLAAPACAIEPKTISVPADTGAGLDDRVLKAARSVCGGQETYEGYQGLDRRREEQRHADCLTSLRLETGASPEAVAALDRARQRLR